MNLEEKKKLIEDGKQELNKGCFPEKILESIKEKRLRGDISKQIFSLPGNQKFENFSIEEKAYRRLRINVRNLFDDYLTSQMMFKNVSYLLLIVGLITSTTSISGLNPNLIFGAISLVIGIIILFVSFSRSSIIKFVLAIAIVYLLISITEIIVIGIPSPFIYAMDNDVLASRRGALLKTANLLTPLAYETIRFVISGILFYIHFKIKKYQKAKIEFENTKLSANSTF